MALSAGKGGASGLGSTGLNYGVKGETGEAEILKVFKYTGEAKGHGASGRPRSSMHSLFAAASGGSRKRARSNPPPQHLPIECAM